MASIGSYYITVMPDMSKFDGEIVRGLNKAGSSSGKSFSSSFLDSIKSTALGVAVGNAISSGISTVMSGLETGIQRLDIIKNFPRVMQNLGVDSAAAAESIDRVQKSLVGLPTALQDGVQSVQRLTTSVGDVGRATDIFIAFNNALVSGAAPASLQASALEQFSQAVAKGKPDMLEWRSMMSAMPAQLEQIAASMGMTSSALGEGLRNGTISMDDFLDAIIALNTEGVGEFGSFQEQVTSATSTVGTALTNVTNRIGAGWASILDVIGQKNLFDAINAVSTAVQGFMEGVAGAVQWLKYTLLGTDIGESLARIGETIGSWAEKATEGLPSIKDIARAVIDFVDGALKWIADNSDVVLAFLTTALEIVGAIFAFQIAAKIAAFIPVLQGLFAAIMANPIAAIIGAIALLVVTLVNWFTTTDEGREAWERLKGGVVGVIDRIKGAWESFKDAWGKAWDAIKRTAKNVWGGIKDFLKKTWEAIKSLFTKGSESVTSTVSSKFSWLRDKLKAIWDAITGAVKAVWEGIKKIIQGIAEAIVSLVKGDFDGLKTALGTIWGGISSIASTVWGGIKTAIGNLASAAASGVKATWEGMKTTASTVWGGIKTAASTVWGGIRDAISGPMNTAKGTVSTVIGNMQSTINGLKGKSVSASVTDSGTGVVSRVQSAINNLRGKTVYVDVKKTGISGIITNLRAARDGWTISTYASGGIATKATAGIFGEAGTEAIIPLSNRSKVRPFARAVANEMPIGGGVSTVNVTGNTFHVRNEADIDRIAQRISLYQSRKMAGRL